MKFFGCFKSTRENVVRIVAQPSLKISLQTLKRNRPLFMLCIGKGIGGMYAATFPCKNPCHPLEHQSFSRCRNRSDTIRNTTLNFPGLNTLTTG